MCIITTQSITKSRVKLLHLSREDFFEALVRCATLKSLPTDAEVAAAGCRDGGELILRLRRGEPAKYTEFLGTADPLRASSGARQPTDRALHHLIALIIRTINGPNGADDGLSLTAGALRNFKAAEAAAEPEEG